MASETVRIRPDTHAKLKQLAERSGQSMPELLERAVEAYRRETFLKEANRAYAGLKSDAEAWSQEEAERAQELLTPWIPPADRYAMHILLIAHGRQTCRAPSPRCDFCPLRRMCPHGRSIMSRPVSRAN